MIRNIVFDMGQVLIHWSAQRLVSRLPLEAEDAALLRREVFGNTEWIRLDQGSITEAQALESICLRLPEQLHGHARELVTGWWRAPLEPMEGMEALLRELKGKGFRLYLLSNASVRLRTYFPRIPGADCFDGVMVSAEEKLLKPSGAIYRRLLEKFSLRPEECFFIDDSPANVAGAQDERILGTVFHGDVQRLRRELASVLKSDRE